jgi:hypothetical protein
MRLPDPFAPLAGGPLHRFDIAIAESLTGVRRRSISRHIVQPLVLAGVSAATAVALLHWVLIGLGVLVIVGLMSRALRRA